MFRHAGAQRQVLRKGSGPGVVVIAEIPGITPRLLEFSDRLVDAGFSVALPHLFGEIGRPLGRRSMLRSMGQVCISRQFSLLATRRSSPITVWLRALARQLHAEVGGPGVGAVGMCLTGGFALAMMADDVVLAPVLSQPALPLPVTAAAREDLGLGDEDLARVRERASQGACVLGMRFSEDPKVPEARFERLRRELGEAFISVEIDSSAGNPHGIPANAHGVLTDHFVDQPGHPTRDALDRVVQFLHERLDG